MQLFCIPTICLCKKGNHEIFLTGQVIMASQRPPSGRPMSRGPLVAGTGRPPTAIRPPQTAIRVGTGVSKWAGVIMGWVISEVKFSKFQHNS